MQDLLDHQIGLGDPDLSANYPKTGEPQIGTVSIAGNDLKFGDVSIRAVMQSQLQTSDTG